LDEAEALVAVMKLDALEATLAPHAYQYAA